MKVLLVTILFFINTKVYSKTIEENILNFAKENSYIALHNITSLGLNTVLFKKYNPSKFIAFRFNFNQDLPQNIVTTKEGFFSIIEIAKGKTLLYFESFTSEELKTELDLIKKAISNNDVSKTSSFTLNLFSRAHAAESCTTQNLETASALSNNLIATINNHSFVESLVNCFQGVIYDATVGTIQVAADCISYMANEVCEIIKNPIDKLSSYGETISKGVNAVTNFITKLSQLMTDPTKAKETFASLGSDMQKFMSGTYEKISHLPASIIFEFTCIILGGIGIDALITTLTGGAATPKLLLTLKKLTTSFNKLENILKYIKKLTFSKLNISESKMKTFFQSVMNDKIPSSKLDELSKYVDEGEDFGRLGLKAITCAL